MRSAGTLPVGLSEALEQAGSIAGVEVQGTLDIAFFRDGDLRVVNRHEFSAFVEAGRLHVRATGLATDEVGGRLPIVERVLLDGDTLLLEQEGFPVGQAYLPGYFDLPGVLRSKVGPYRLLQCWQKGLFGVVGVAGSEYQVARQGSREQIVESYPGVVGPGADGSATFVIGGSPVRHIQSVEHRYGNGGLRLRRTFEAYEEIAPSVVRPRVVRETLFDLEGRPEISRVLSIHSARQRSPLEAREDGWLTTRCADWWIYQ